MRINYALADSLKTETDENVSSSFNGRPVTAAGAVKSPMGSSTASVSTEETMLPNRLLSAATPFPDLGESLDSRRLGESLNMR
jgi:hypothetical protein